MNLYTPEVREYVRSRDWPKGLQLDVNQVYTDIDDLSVPHLEFVIYRDNWLTFGVPEQLKIASIIKEVMEKLRADRIPCYMAAMKNREEG